MSAASLRAEGQSHLQVLTDDPGTPATEQEMGTEVERHWLSQVHFYAFFRVRAKGWRPGLGAAG